MLYLEVIEGFLHVGVFHDFLCLLQKLLVVNCHGFFPEKRQFLFDQIAGENQSIHINQRKQTERIAMRRERQKGGEGGNEREMWKKTEELELFI